MSGQQQLLQAEPQQQQFHYAPTNSGSQMYDSWPGMALKQIMGQIDLLNFQNPNYANASKWAGNKEFVNGSGGNSSAMVPICAAPGNGIMPQQQQQQQQQQSFKANSAYDCGQMDSDNSAAWLGPQLWNRRVGVDVSNESSANHSPAADQLFDSSANIKTEMSSPELDFSSWCQF
jgi:hypothetical protein